MRDWDPGSSSLMKDFSRVKISVHDFLDLQNKELHEMMLAFCYPG